MQCTARMLVFVAAFAVLSSVALAEKSVKLFNGENLDGWEHFLVDPDVKMEDVWSVEEGLLVCQGEPMGYLCSKESYENFKLIVEWRWAPGEEPGNSGVLMRITGKPMALPKCVEAQLKHGSAGDIWAFQGFQVTGDKERFKEIESEKIGKFQGVSKIEGAERQPGKWNKYEITLSGGDLTLVVNGKKVNEATGCDQVAGKIGLQSEGGQIQFRTVRLIPLDK